MTQISFGYYGVHETAIHASDELAERVASICADPRWPWQPALVRSTQFPRRPLFVWPKGKLRPTAIATTVKGILRSDDTLGIDLRAGGTADNNHAWLHLESGQAGYCGPAGTAYHFEVRALCRGGGLPAGKTLAGWIELMHELSITVQTPNAVIIASEDERAVVAMLYGSGGGPFPPGEHRDVPRYEIARVNRGREWLGSKFTRPAAWGTYLKPEHLAAIGGRERIVEVVNPPVLRDVGSLLYVQLSERAEDAVAPDTLARKRAFWELLAPPVAVPYIAMG